MLRLPLAPSHLFKHCPSVLKIVRTSPTLPIAAFTSPSYILIAAFSSRSLATMTSTQSKACCTVPPVVSEGYQAKGDYITIDGMKTYATGPKDAKSALLVVYDIFGFFPQTLQGADILAHADKEHQYQVFMPDFFDGKPADISWYPPDNEEKGKKLGE